MQQGDEVVKEVKTFPIPQDSSASDLIHAAARKFAAKPEDLKIFVDTR